MFGRGPILMTMFGLAGLAANQMAGTWLGQPGGFDRPAQLPFTEIGIAVLALIAAGFLFLFLNTTMKVARGALVKISLSGAARFKLLNLTRTPLHLTGKQSRRLNTLHSLVIPVMRVRRHVRALGPGKVIWDRPAAGAGKPIEGVQH
jgi:hypothetical protein